MLDLQKFNLDSMKRVYCETVKRTVDFWKNVKSYFEQKIETELESSHQNQY